MRYQLKVTLTEEDYLTFNCFQNLESTYGRKTVRRFQIALAVLGAVYTVFMLMLEGFFFFLDSAGLSVLGIIVIMILLFKKFMAWTVKMQVKQLKKAGKLPYNKEANLEFYEDKIVAVSENSQAELNYSGLERLCIVKNRYIYAYNSSLSAIILPIPQIRQQVNEGEFLQFLTEKCPNVEHYQ